MRIAEVRWYHTIKREGKMWQSAASAINHNKGAIDRTAHYARATKDALERLSGSDEM